MPSSTPEQNPHDPSAEEKPFDPLDFPPGLIQKQHTLAAVYADLHRFSANPDLTWSLEPHAGWDDSRSGRWGRPRGRRPGGWTEDQKTEYNRGCAIAVSCHPHWKAIQQHCSLERGQGTAGPEAKGAELGQDDIAAAA
ncbi:hypothetical protein [Streptomyces sp. NPDC059881]|uniref:hypothetical protein n=1 Tax=Streptomyces sp. NPDC059881 TaxID=3346986 RepID=UPI003651FD34